MEVEQQVVIIWTVTNGLADDIAVEDLKRFESELVDYMRNAHPGVINTMRDKKNIDDTLKAQMKEAVEDFKASRWDKNSMSTVA